MARDGIDLDGAASLGDTHQREHAAAADATDANKIVGYWASVGNGAIWTIHAWRITRTSPPIKPRLRDGVPSHARQSLAVLDQSDLFQGGRAES